MLSITTTTAQQAIFSLAAGQTALPVQISAVITETNPALSRVRATLNWNDGTPPVSFGPGKPLNLSATRNLAVGSYFITLTAFNYLQPQPQTTSIFFSFEIQPQQIVQVPQEFLFGPILPMDDGFPNAQQWAFSLGNDLDVLKSSVKMLLITSKGERIMQPTYGTLLKRALFEPSTNSIQTIVQQEITEALANFEPRVSLESLSVSRADTGGRSLLVNARFQSRISLTTFNISVPVSVS